MANLVTVGKPAAGGAIFVAPIGTALPTDAKTTLNAAFVSCGHISEDGVTSSNERESEDIKDWAGSTVLSVQTGVNDAFSWTFIDALSTDVLKVVFGDDNVTGNLATGITVKSNATELVAHSYVIDMIMTDGAKKRIVIPNGKVSEVGEVVYQSGEAVGYEVTVAALPDASDNTHYEYIVEKPTA